MKRTFQLTLILFIVIALVSCQKEEEVPEGYHRVIVLEKAAGGNYSYFLVKEKDNRYWIATNFMDEVEVGDTLFYSNAMEMTNFYSKSLEKEFERILFVEDASKTPYKTPEFIHPEIGNLKDNTIKIDPLPGGLTIEQIYKDRENLNGKIITLKGKVTKFNDDILGKNWIHLQDGSGDENNFDLLVTSDAFVNIGDIIIVRGKVAINKDFGAGYRYDVLIEDAVILPEL